MLVPPPKHPVRLDQNLEIRMEDGEVSKLAPDTLSSMLRFSRGRPTCHGPLVPAEEPPESSHPRVRRFHRQSTRRNPTEFIIHHPSRGQEFSPRRIQGQHAPVRDLDRHRGLGFARGSALLAIVRTKSRVLFPPKEDIRREAEAFIPCCSYLLRRMGLMGIAFGGCQGNGDSYLSIGGGGGGDVGLDLDDGSAEGARGVGVEPHVDTVDVETVTASREQPRLLALLELGKTDGTLEAILVTLGLEVEDREGADDGGVEPQALHPERVLIGSEDETAPPGAGDAAAGTPEPTSVQVEQHDEDDHGKKKDDRCYHDLSSDENASRLIV
ncbi:unnamed protein product [Victoria cruziana]